MSYEATTPVRGTLADNAPASLLGSAPGKGPLASAWSAYPWERPLTRGITESPKAAAQSVLLSVRPSLAVRLLQCSALLTAVRQQEQRLSAADPMMAWYRDVESDVRTACSYNGIALRCEEQQG